MILHLKPTFTSSITNLDVDYFAKPVSESDSDSIEDTTSGRATEIVLNFLEDGIELPVWRS